MVATPRPLEKPRSRCEENPRPRCVGSSVCSPVSVQREQTKKKERWPAKARAPDMRLRNVFNTLRGCVPRPLTLTPTGIWFSHDSVLPFAPRGKRYA